MRKRTQTVQFTLITKGHVLIRASFEHYVCARVIRTKLLKLNTKATNLCRKIGVLLKTTCAVR